MTSALNKLLSIPMGLGLLCLLAACESKNVSGGAIGEYVTLVKAEDNSLHQTVSVPGVEYTLFYEPALYKFIKENRDRVNQLSKSQVQEGGRDYGDIYLELSIDVQSHKLEWIKGAWQEGSIKTDTDLAFMVCGMDTLRPMGMHFVPGQEVQGKNVVNLVFANCNNTSAPTKYLIRDMTRENKSYLVFEFDANEIDQFTQLNN